MGQLTWSLADPGLDVLARVGVGAMALAVDAARENGHDLGPLQGRFDATELHLSWPDDVSDQAALTPFIEWVWQTRGAPAGQDPAEGMGILYLPGIHRGERRDDPTQRLVEHSGILSTFLQHPRIQGKTKPKTTESRIDDHVIRLRYVEPTSELPYLKDFAKQLFKRKRLVTGAVSFSSYIRPGATARHQGESSWTGRASEALALLCAPTACFYLQIRGRDWVVVAPDPGDLKQFALRRPAAALSQRGMMAASAADAGLRVLVAMRARFVARQLERGRGVVQECVVMRVGQVAWNRQSVRNRALRLRPTEEMVHEFELLERRLTNRLKPRAGDGGVFVTVPSPRGVIADNLVAGVYWYRGLLDVPTELREQVEKNRRKGESTQRVWFRWVRAHRKELRAFMDELEESRGTSTGEADAIFREAFHRALRGLYGREATQAQRGSRTVTDRLEDRTEKIRRELAKAQTRQHVRGVLAELFAEAGRNRVLQTHAQTIWRFMDDPQDWRRARDLALLSLATYSRPGGDAGADQAGDQEVDEGEEA